MKRKSVSGFLAGMLCGAVVFGGGAAYAASVMASPSTHHVTVDGIPVSVEAYNIAGNNYFQLRDLARLVGFNVTWDNTTRTVEIDTDAGDSEAELPTEQPETATTPDVDTVTDLDSIREEIVERTNALRRENGLPALTMDNDTVLQHTGTLLMGENMGMKDLSGQSLDKLAELQVDSWEQSDGHCRNMLHTIYHSMGTGVAQDEYGMYYVVQLFAGGDYMITGVAEPILP